MHWESQPCEVSNMESSTSLNSLIYCQLFFSLHITMINHIYIVFMVERCLLSQLWFFHQLFLKLTYIPCPIYTKTCYFVNLAFHFIRIIQKVSTWKKFPVVKSLVITFRIHLQKIKKFYHGNFFPANKN